MRAVNLIPADQRSGQPVGAGRSKGGAYAVLVLVGGAALMVYLYGEARHQVTSRSGQIASITQQVQQAQAAAERLAPYTSFIAMREQRMQAVDSLVDSRFDWAHVLHEFGRVLPPHASITSLSGTVGGGSTATASASPSTSSSATASPSTSSSSTASSSSSSSGATTAASSSVTSATPSGSVPTFTISGCATTQPVVAQTLERLHLIDGVAEVTLQSSTSGSSSGGGGSSGGGSGGCPGSDVSFSTTVTFVPLPSTAAVAAAAKTVSDQTGADSASAKTTTTKVSAK